ncbi:zona pellucida-binding protein 1 [Trichosurus vulpecula]|uniref:zona pellucida-binding protein 1 n=1 Tax=Trichosurus vulpecula TaxID=9337 RepID=UPI00186B5536|nr:zona pellucida-binding protein 1 [Trichosurus vulpecula]
MEGAARVLLRRARESRLRRCRLSQYLPPLSLLLLFLHLQTSPSIGYFYPERYLRQVVGDTDTVKLVGSTNIPVKIYVMLNHNSPHLLCVTRRLRNVELIDPVFHWHAPIGNAVPENSSVKVTTTGSLIFYNFSEEMSGIYTCSLSYKRTAEEVEKTLQLKYVIYAYVNPNFYYQFTARYHSAPCNSIYNVSFEKKLLQILSRLVIDLFCEIKLVKSECHHVKMQRAGLQNELFFTFSVAPIENGTKGPDECTSSSCDPVERLDKAKNLIERFFIQQVEVLGRHSEPLPEIYYIEGTLKMVWINRCRPGYGMNALVHPNCPDCCVICNPGTYNPHSGTHCLQCNSSMVYGGRKC